MSHDDQSSEGGNAHAPVDAEAIREFAEAILYATPQPLLVLNAELKVEMVNPAFCQQFNVSEQETMGRFLYDLGNRQWDIPELRELLRMVVDQGKRIQQYRVEHDFDSIGWRVMLVGADLMTSKEPGDSRILLALSDLTETERTKWELEGQKEYAEKIVDAVRDPLLIVG